MASVLPSPLIDRLSPKTSPFGPRSDASMIDRSEALDLEGSNAKGLDGGLNPLYRYTFTEPVAHARGPQFWFMAEIASSIPSKDMLRL